MKFTYLLKMYVKILYKNLSHYKTSNLNKSYWNFYFLTISKNIFLKLLLNFKKYVNKGKLE